MYDPGSANGRPSPTAPGACWNSLARVRPSPEHRGDEVIERPYELAWTAGGVEARDRGVLASPLLNRGTAFVAAERAALGLTGLLPEAVCTIQGQLARVYRQYRRQPDDLAKNLYLASLRDRNEVLFYRLLAEHIAEMLPIVYTPTIGTAIERYSYEYGLLCAGCTCR